MFTHSQQVVRVEVVTVVFLTFVAVRYYIVALYTQFRLNNA